MRRVRRWSHAVAFTLGTLLLAHPAPPGLEAQDLERDFCPEGLPGVNCTDDTLEVIVPLGPALDNHVFRYSTFVADTRVDTNVLIGAVDARIQGWSFGVAHDAAFLSLIPESVTTDGTIADPDHPAGVFREPGFDVTEAVDGGYISGIVLSFTEDTVLPAGRHPVAKASYLLVADTGEEGTRLRLSDELGTDPARPVAINITIGGRAFLPRRITDGLVVLSVIPQEDCTNGLDDDGDRLIDQEDPECHDCPCGPTACLENALYFGSDTLAGNVDALGAQSFSIASRNVDPLLGFQLGVAIRPEGQLFVYEFSSRLGTDPERLVEVLFTNHLGQSIVPLTPNVLTSDTATVVRLRRGSALTGEPGDFFDFDLEPGTGGPGFFVGYVADLDGNENPIPPTPPAAGAPCPVNELLVVDLSPVIEECPPYAFLFGDRADAGEVNAAGQASFALSTRNVQPLLGLQLGVAIRPQGDLFAYEFSGGLGTDEERLVEPLMTDSLGNSIVPATPNHLVADRSEVTAIRRGAAVEAFDPGDFFEFDLDPSVGGPGFFLGYVSDLDGNVNQIPATPAGDGCPVNEVFVVELGGAPGCPVPFAFYFGSEPVSGMVNARGQPEFTIAASNARELFGFQFGVQAISGEDGVRFRFSNEVGTDSDRLVEVLMTDVLGDSVVPATPSELVADTQGVADIARGAALEPFAGGDFFEFDLEPGVGGPGFFVGYVSDLDGDEVRIPATAGETCRLNELLVVRLGAARPFARADADGNGRVNVSDAVLIVQGILGNLRPRFDCDDLFDTDASGQLELADALPPLVWLFRQGPALPEPFLECGTEDDDRLGCVESNCQGLPGGLSDLR